MFSKHFNRVKEGANNVHSLHNLSGWISKYTFIEGKHFSYLDHEYQKDIIDDPARTLLVNKCAQTGLSEIFARWGMAACATQDNFTLIWTFPSTSDAERFTKARLDPMINASPELTRAISKTINSVELKQFNSNSFSYIRGTISDTGALSVPADLLIHDELDRSDMDNISAYVSRLQHKPTKMRRLFSTPTVAKYGISLECETAKRKHQMWKCSHCNHHFLPSYEEDVHIPGFNGQKKEITKTTIKDIDYRSARLLCPKCKQEPDSDIAYRSWVVENPQDNYEKVAYYVSPFCAPKILVPSYLVHASTEFGKYSEFQNQALGLTAEDKEESLTETDIRRMLVNAELVDSGVHYLGADMGLTCHLTVSRLAPTGELLVVHREKVNYVVFEQRRRDLISKYRISTSVHDMFPYTDLVRRVTDFDPNAYGAIYVDKLSTETHYVKEQEETPEEGKLNVRAVMVNRDVALDELMADIKAGKILVKEQADAEEFVAHLRDMKRVKAFDKHGGIRYRWKKTQGEDHWHHSLLYSYIACKLRGAVQAPSGALGSLLSKFRLRA